MSELGAAASPILLVACGLMVLGSALYSGGETGLYCMNRLRLNVRASQRDSAALTLQRLVSDQPGALFTLLLGTYATDFFASFFLTQFFLRSGLAPGQTELYTSIALTPVVLIFGEILPKVLFERQADRLMGLASRILWASYRSLRLVGGLAVQRQLARVVLGRARPEAALGSAMNSRMHMYELLHEGAEQGALTRTQRTMLERMTSLQGVRVTSVMVPQAFATMVPHDARVADVLPLIRESRFSRFPVFQGSRQKLIGLVHVLDLLTQPPEKPISSLMLPPIEVRHDTDIMHALHLLQEKSRRMAFVIDAQGQGIGVVTMKDLVEEIVGELGAW